MSLQGGEALRRSVIKPRLRYRLRHGHVYFDAGLASRGRQVLMGFFWTGLQAIFFDAKGILLGTEERPLPVEAPRHPGSGVTFHTPEFDAAVAKAWRRWKTAIRFVGAPIQVRAFTTETGLGIIDRPQSFEAFLDDPGRCEPGEDAQRQTLESIREWEDGGCFVLRWGNELWVNGEGEVIAS